MSTGAATAWLGIWLVLVIVSSIGMIKFLNHAKRTEPEAYARMMRRSKKNAKWVAKTYLTNPAKDFWGRR